MCETTTELPVTDKNSSGCSCCDTGADSADGAESAESVASVVTGNIQLHVRGMTCGHCVSSVTEELEEADGVRNVSVDLVPGGTSTVTVDADAGSDSPRLRATIADAGYKVVTL